MTDFTDEDLDELSAADLKIVDETWNQFGGLNEWDLRLYTHKHCPEWQHPGGSSIPIIGVGDFQGVGMEPLRMPCSRNSASRNNDISSASSPASCSSRAQRMDPPDSFGTG